MLADAVGGRYIIRRKKQGQEFVLRGPDGPLPRLKLGGFHLMAVRGEDGHGGPVPLQKGLNAGRRGRRPLHTPEEKTEARVRFART
jgi:hypothetical protein